jgi:hypothetical protein
MNTTQLERVLAHVRALVGENDEWTEYDRFVPIEVVTGASPRSRWVFSTKVSTLMRMVGTTDVPDDVGLIGRYGVGSPATFEVVKKVLGPDCTVDFFGDLDPLDLTIYLLLRNEVPVRYIGVSQPWLVAAEAAFPTSPPRTGLSFERHTIKMTTFEQEHWRLLKQAGFNLDDVLGSAATEILDAGRKVELEAVINGERFGPGHKREVLRLLDW